MLTFVIKPYHYNTTAGDKGLSVQTPIMVSWLRVKIGYLNFLPEEPFLHFNLPLTLVLDVLKIYFVFPGRIP